LNLSICEAISQLVKKDGMGINKIYLYSYLDFENEIQRWRDSD
jgi:hypothetical protein